MGDRAFEAAERAWGALVERMRVDPSEVIRPYEQSVDAAREALAPIRQLHARLPVRCGCCFGWSSVSTPVPARYRCACGADHWPCATANLVYSADEIAEEARRG